MGRLKREDCESKICPICEEEFSIKDDVKPYRFMKQDCCSRQCNAIRSSRFCIGKKAHNNKRIKVKCRWCHKKRKVSLSLSKRPYCSRQCMREHCNSGIRKGENHWNWQGGITEQAARDVLYEGYKFWRISVFKRDNYKCTECDCNESGELQAHHIKPVKTHKELVVVVSNGVTVCKTCHKGIHYGNN